MTLATCNAYLDMFLEPALMPVLVQLVSRTWPTYCWCGSDIQLYQKQLASVKARETRRNR